MTTTPQNHLTERFDEALVYASCIHRDQRRKGADIPYVSHLLGVAAIAIENGATEDQAIAALLHDAVEDQGGATRLEDIRTRFGEQVWTRFTGGKDGSLWYYHELSDAFTGLAPGMASDRFARLVDEMERLSKR